MTAVRKGDWERALAGYLAECEGRPFAWGTHDCLLFSAGAELAMTGHDPAAEIRGRYRSQAGAARLLRERGFASLEEAVDANKPQVPPGIARRGDWALYGEAVGVVVGRFALFPGDLQLADDPTILVHQGLLRVPRPLWRKAWSVG